MSNAYFFLRYHFMFALLLTVSLTLSTPPLLASVTAQSDIDFSDEEIQFIKEHPVVIVGGEQDWPPFDFVQDGEYIGAANDYLKVLSRYTGLTFDVKTGMVWDELLNGLKTKQLDMLPMVYWSQQRTDFMNYTESFLTIRQYIFTHQDDLDLNVMADLNHKTVAVPKGYAQAELLRNSHPDINILEVKDSLAAIDAVITKKADAFIENTALVSYLSKEHNIQGLRAASATTLGIHKLHMATRQDWPILRNIIQKGLNAMTRAEHKEIARKWLTLNSENNSVNQHIKLSKEQQQYLHQKKVIKACVAPHWMPLEAIKDGHYIGLGADYLALFQQKISTPIKVVPTTSWSESIQLGKTRVCDIFLLSMDTSERRSFMDVTTPYLELPLVLATKPDVIFVSDFNELRNKKIGIIEGYALIKILKNEHPTTEFVYVPSVDVGLRMVADGTLFGFLDTVSTIGYGIQNQYFGELKIGGKFGIDWKLGVATRNDEPPLGQIFEEIILDIPEQTKQEIMSQWMSKEYIQKFDYDLLWKIISGFSVLLLIGFLRNRQLVNHQEEISLKNNELEKINTLLETQKDEIQQLADHDFLTGLPNRKSFSGRLNHAIDIATRQNQNLAIIFIDLDRFKNINDTFGHHVGDDMLKILAERLKNLLRDSDTIARIGGDEFLILLEAVDDLKFPGIVAKKILATLRQPIDIAEHSLTNSASIGIALFPEDGSDASTLIKNADSAMYLAKDNGKDHYQYYTQQLSKQIERRLAIEHALQDAIQNQQLSLVFQPQMDLKNQKIIGAEALVRWTHPELGNISPIEFIPIAEDTRLILDIGEWVFRTACQEFIKWRKAGFAMECLAINVSSVQFKQPNLTELFSDIIEQYDIAAKHIEIEITERYVMTHTEENQFILNELREIGFKISVDDFGTGYSSMSYLKTLPLDIIKIDKSFINDIPHDNNDVQITKAILALSHSLGYTVIAEGIENEQQLNMLQEMQCDVGQGYYLSKPLPSDELIKFLGKHKI